MDRLEHIKTLLAQPYGAAALTPVDVEWLVAQLSEAQARLAEIERGPHLFSISSDRVTCTLSVDGQFVGYVVDVNDCSDEIAKAYRERGFGENVSETQAILNQCPGCTLCNASHVSDEQKSGDA